MDGFSVGGFTCAGNPCDIRTFGTEAQPGVVEAYVVAVQEYAKPGTALAAAAAANVAIGSKEIPYPA